VAEADVQEEGGCARVACGFLVAPGLPALGALFIDRGLSGFMLFAYPAAWLIGFPLFVVYHNQGWNALWQYVLGSFILGFCVSSVFGACQIAGSNEGSLIEVALLSAIPTAVAVIVGIVFWFIAVREPRVHP
jgi:hypothetical protein